MPLSKADIKYRSRRQLCNPVAETVPEEAPGLPDPDYSDRDRCVDNRQRVWPGEGCKPPVQTIGARQVRMVTIGSAVPARQRAVLIVVGTVAGQ